MKCFMYWSGWQKAVKHRASTICSIRRHCILWTQKKSVIHSISIRQSMTRCYITFSKGIISFGTSNSLTLLENFRVIYDEFLNAKSSISHNFWYPNWIYTLISLPYIYINSVEDKSLDFSICAGVTPKTAILGVVEACSNHLTLFEQV